MKHRTMGVLFAALCLLAGPAAARAQEKKAEGMKMEAPKPGPEHKKLGYFTGTWKTEGEVKENPFMPAGKMTSTDKCEWYHGGFHVVCHSTGKSPMGPSYGLGILGYNAEEKAYTYNGIDNMGMGGQGKGSVEGSTWTYTNEEKMGGKAFHGRYTINELSPTSYTFKYETSEDRQNWATVMEGKSTKTGAKK